MAQTKHVTLAAGIVLPVDLETNGARIEVFNRPGNTDDVWFTTDDHDPTVGGDDVHIVTPGSAVEVSDETSGRNSIVKLLSVGTPKVSVRVV